MPPFTRRAENSLAGVGDFVRRTLGRKDPGRVSVDDNEGPRVESPDGNGGGDTRIRALPSRRRGNGKV